MQGLCSGSGLAFKNLFDPYLFFGFGVGAKLGGVVGGFQWNVAGDVSSFLFQICVGR